MPPRANSARRIAASSRWSSSYSRARRQSRHSEHVERGQHERALAVEQPEVGERLERESVQDRERPAIEQERRRTRRCRSEIASDLRRMNDEPRERDALERREHLQRAAHLPRERPQQHGDHALREVQRRQRVAAVVERRTALAGADRRRVELGLHRAERERRQTRATSRPDRPRTRRGTRRSRCRSA